MKTYKSPWRQCALTNQTFSETHLLGAEQCYQKYPVNQNSSFDNSDNPYNVKIGDQLYPDAYPQGKSYPRYLYKTIEQQYGMGKVNVYIIDSPDHENNGNICGAEGINNFMKISDLKIQQIGKGWDDLSKYILLQPAGRSPRTIAAKWNYVTRDMLNSYFQYNNVNIDYKGYSIEYRQPIDVSEMNGAPVSNIQMQYAFDNYNVYFTPFGSTVDNSDVLQNLKIYFYDAQGNQISKVVFYLLGYMVNGDGRYPSDDGGMKLAFRFMNPSITRKLFDQIIVQTQDRLLDLNKATQMKINTASILGQEYLIYSYTKP